MTDQTKKVSDFPKATSIDGNDRLLILQSPESNAIVRTVNVSILIANIAVVGGYITSSQLSSNLVNYVTRAELEAEVGAIESNNASFLAGYPVESFVNTAQLASNLENYVSTSQLTTTLNSYVTKTSLTSNLALYQTTAGLASNVVTLTANDTLFFGGLAPSEYINSSSLTSVLTQYVTSTSLASNLALYQTTAGLSSNVARLTSNNTSYVGTTPSANVVSDVSLAANLANYVLISNLATALAGADANNAAYLGGIIADDYVTGSELTSNLASYATIDYLISYTSSRPLGTITELTVGNTSVNTYISNTATIKLSNTSANITIAIPNTTASSATNYFLHANGSWAPSINLSSQYIWTNTHTFSQTINATSNNALYLGGTIASGYQTTAGLSANVATLAANSASYLGTFDAATYQKYDVSGFVANTIFESEVIFGFTPVRNVRFPGNFSGSKAYSRVASSGSYVINVKKNGSDVGTITFSTSNTGTFATSGGANVDIVANDMITFHGNNVVDTTLADISFTLKGVII